MRGLKSAGSILTFSLPRGSGASPRGVRLRPAAKAVPAASITAATAAADRRDLRIGSAPLHRRPGRCCILGPPHDRAMTARTLEALAQQPGQAGAGATACDSGRESQASAPPAGTSATEATPPCDLAIVATIARPSPLPPRP